MAYSEPTVLGVPWRGVAALHPVGLLPEDLEFTDTVPLPGFTSGGIDYADFLMDRFEVTNADFAEFVEDGGYSSPGSGSTSSSRTARC